MLVSVVLKQFQLVENNCSISGRWVLLRVLPIIISYMEMSICILIYVSILNIYMYDYILIMKYMLT